MGSIAEVLLLLVVVSVAFWGGLGAAVSSERGGGWRRGLLWGAVLGPWGIGVVLWLTRRSRRSGLRTRTIDVIDLTDRPVDASGGGAPDLDWGVSAAPRRSRASDW